MTLAFDSWAFEVYNGGWVNVTHDVRSEPHPQWTRGIMGNAPDDHVGYPCALSFSLRNDAGCLGAKVGYYSPGHANCWAGWTTGLIVRLSFTFEGQPYYKFYGRIKPDGITVTPGMYGQRDISVEVGDWMYFAGNHEMKSTPYTVNQNIGQLVNLVNANMPISPLATSIATGVENFPSVFDINQQGATALSEYVKGAMSEWGYIYPRGDLVGGETLVVEAQNTRTNAVVTQIPRLAAFCGKILNEDTSLILKEDGGALLFGVTQAAVFDNKQADGMQIGFGKTTANRVTSTVYPRKPASGITLWSLNKSFQILPGQTITGYQCSYVDPSQLAQNISADQTSCSTSATATLNEDGSGGSITANLTATPVYGSDSTIYTLYNNSSTTALWVQTLTITGNGVYIYTSASNVQDNTASELANGVVPLSLDFKYQASSTKANALASYVLGQEGLPHVTVDAFPMWANADEMRMYGFLALEPGTKATFKESQSGISGDYFINGYTAELYPKGNVLFTPLLNSNPSGGSIMYPYGVIASTLNSVCWSPEKALFVAVGYGADAAHDVYTSPDGINWTNRTSAQHQSWTSVCWSPALTMFCAVSSNTGSANDVMTSSDGTTWNLQAGAAQSTWESICWSVSLGVFVATGQGTGVTDCIMTSTNGTAWTLRTAPYFKNWSAVCWSPDLGMFCAIAVQSTNNIMTSTNGTAWSAQTGPANSEWDSICWSPSLGIFCAMADGGGGNNDIALSSNGTSWTMKSSGINIFSVTSICWSPEYSEFMVVSTNVGLTPQYNQLATSPDGINWKWGINQNVNAIWNSVCYSPALKLFVAVGVNAAMASK
jgi:hypothetical protein